MSKEKKIKLEVIVDDQGVKTIEAQYKIGSNVIKVDLTFEVLKAFKDYFFLDSKEDTIHLNINRENKDDEKTD